MMPTKSNMYNWITKTWNPIRGTCPHSCKYCYVKRSRVKKLYTGQPRLVGSKLKQSLGKDHFWFVGSMIDLFADDIKSEDIIKVLEHCQKYKNKYLFQSKNPGRMIEFLMHFPSDTVLGTTIETNRYYPDELGKAPSVIKRALALKELSDDFPVMVTVEPVMDFDVPIMELYIGACNPEWVNIGADSKNSGLPEPSAEKINELIKNLKAANIEVKIKNNLKRLTRGK